MPFFSVIIPAYNRADFLKKAADSVLSQTFNDFELIIVDDGSEDGTKKLVNSLPDQRIKYIYQDNSGVSAARNRGIKEAEGEFIAFLDSDDWWLPGKLEETEKHIKNNPDYRIFHTQEKWFRGGAVLNQKKVHRKPHGDIFARCLKLCCVSISTAVIHKSVFEKVGLFNKSFPACEDYDFWLRVSAEYTVYLMDKVLTEKEGGHPDQQSKRFAGMDRFRIRAICDILDSGKLDSKRYKTALKELKRKCRIYANGCFKRGKFDEGKKYMDIIEKYREQEK